MAEQVLTYYSLTPNFSFLFFSICWATHQKFHANNYASPYGKRFFFCDIITTSCVTEYMNVIQVSVYKGAIHSKLFMASIYRNKGNEGENFIMMTKMMWCTCVWRNIAVTASHIGGVYAVCGMYFAVARIIITGFIGIASISTHTSWLSFDHKFLVHTYTRVTTTTTITIV